MTQFTIYYGTPEGKDPKIGVCCAHPRRIKKQKIRDGVILEVHTCVYEVSRREMELQRQYGVKVDTTPYHVQYFNNKIPGKRAKVSASLMGNTNCLGISRKHTEKTKLQMSTSHRTTTPELDLLVIQDIKSGMSQYSAATKHGIGRSVVKRIVRDSRKKK
tara:strand:+ start:155 stop:634 length:480 start_codon:yes stop_codon:yes gene_type:complete